MKVFILRLGHRRKRDERMSTHCGLVARALGADGIIFSGESDQGLIESIRKVVKNWGGKFVVRYEKNWKKIIKSWNGIKIHLTMYGLPIQDKIKEIRKLGKGRKVLIIIGSEKVPSEVYGLVDYNIAVTNQPHSEVAALAIFLHELFEGKELNKKLLNAKLRIIPSEREKKVIHSQD
ncbi:MAG: tRNA (cytidine(56)-2'-O)-methyltransferase [Candidatus Aenigmarchaeota archaeon]|nr:tRNA (cytidine(56)-2'-O)-methyltransferase [Candidatus Aenigmarchaeota archaeon]